MNNNNKWPFIFSVACVNGNFKNQTCFAETWLRAANASGPTGAVATIMSTINQYWNQPMEGQDMMDTILCEAISNNIKRSFGGITVNGMYKMNDFYGTSGMDMTDTWTIFGDPSVIVRSDNPTPMTVTHSTLEVVGVTQLAINCNKNGAIVCLTKQGNILGTGIVASGSVNITFPAINSIDSIDVTVTAYNCVPYFGKTYVQCPANLMTLNSNNVSICIGSSATLSASGATSYTWNTSSNAASIVVNPMANAQYTVTGTLNNVCYESEVVNVTVNQLPNVTFNQNPTTVCLGSGLVPFNGLPAGGVYAGNGVVGSNFNVGTAGTGSHQIVYTYTDINGCVNTATATMLVDPCASLNENVLAQNISIYPVPATDHIVIKFASTHDGMQVSIYNAIGQVVSQKAIAKGIQNYKLETSEYARGVYFLKVKTNEQIKFVKFVLE
ncbi:MAG: T9SS type A sorting domain-containing protein [Sphingobacteriaceae bacterium]|nr:T9SS type A sorting domain-containing protein [Sphingobacteriaceae bacterium]